MQVKKFRAKTIRDATAKVKKALGSSAMIISTNKLTQSGAGNLFEIAAVPAGGDSFNENSDPFGQVKSELMSIKEMICLLNQSGGVLEKLITNPALLNLYAKLITNGVSDYNARLFLERAGAFNGHTGRVDDIKQRAVNEIAKVIKTKDPFDVADKKQKIAAFIGTT
ncbi:MAG: hypothetical protein HQ552_04295, partial [Desulfobacteraceae bacterium]|nr:hypothetical protein [Desulfobacteraceae bacterium]